MMSTSIVMAVLGVAIVFGLWAGSSAISRIATGMAQAMGAQPQAASEVRKLQINAFLVEGMMAIVMIGLLGALFALIFAGGKPV